MNLIEESFQREKKQKTKKTTKIIMAILIILLIAIIGIIIAIYYLDKTTLKIYLNGQQDAKLKELLVFEEDGNIYVPIRAISSYLGYQSYNGDYSNKSEEINKCYIQSEDEITNFYLNSNKIYKMNLEESDDYEYFYIDKPVKSINGNLYTTIDGIQKAFNVSFVYNKEENNIVIYTLPYLVEYYSKQVLDLGYNKLSDVFNNEKAILENMLIVESANNDLGVINANTGETIIETKYDDIYYLQHTGDFLVKDNSKVGIISKNRETKVQLSYDSIELMDSDAGLYLVKRDNKYGVIDLKGNTKLYIEYDQIGIDISKFDKNDIKNKYILVNKLIPVQKEKKWALFDINGKQVTEFKYDSFGYIKSSNKNAESLLVIPNYDVIVACQNQKYTLLNENGRELMNIIADDIYMEISSGKKSYKINANNNIRDAEEFLDLIGITDKTQDEEDNNEQKANTTQNNTNINSNNIQTNTTNNTQSGIQTQNANQTQNNVQNKNEVQNTNLNQNSNQIEQLTSGTTQDQLQ